MKVYLINLDKDKDRLAAADAQLRRLGVSYERFAAIEARKLSVNLLRSAVDQFRWWCAVGRPVRVGEIGCAMSHYSLYREIKEPACILEDDVILDDRFPEVLSFVSNCLDTRRPQVVLLSNHLNKLSPDGLKKPTIQKIKGDMYTEGYVITPVAARALLNENWPLQTPCDWWGRWVKRGVIALYHSNPTVCRQDQTQYLSGTVDVGCFNVESLPKHKYIIHKAKRVLGRIVDSILNLALI